MIDPYMQQMQASMYMNPWQGYTSAPGMMSGGPQGYMGYANMSNMQNQFGGAGSGIGASVYGGMYDNPFSTSVAMNATNILSRPRGAQHTLFNAHSADIKMGTNAAIMSTGMELSGSLIGGSVGAMVGSALIPIPGVGAIVGSMIGSHIGSALGGKAGSVFANKTGREMEVHRSLMGLANNNSPYGGVVGYSTQDAKKVYSNMEESSIKDPYFGVGDIGRILNEGIKTGNIKGGSDTSEIKEKLKGLKETAKSLVEIFGNSDISDIMDTLRRLNGTGFSNSQAVDVSRTVGMAARSFGMKADDLFNNVSQNAATKEASGSETANASMALQPVKMLMFKMSKSAQKNFRNNDEFAKQLAETDAKYDKAISGKVGSMMWIQHGETSTSGMMVIANAQAIEDSGGRNNFSALTRKQKTKAREKALDEVYAAQDKGNLNALTQNLHGSGSLQIEDYRNILSANTVGLTDSAKAYSATYAASPKFAKKSIESEARVLKIVRKNQYYQAMLHYTSNSRDRAIEDMFENYDSNKFNGYKQRDKEETEAAATRKTGAWDSRWQGWKTSITRGFSTPIEKIEDKLFKHSSTRMDNSSIKSTPAEIMAYVNSSAAKQEIEKGRNNRGIGEMTSVGHESSIFGNWSLSSNMNDQLLNGISTRALMGTMHVKDAHDTLSSIKSYYNNEAHRAVRFSDVSKAFAGADTGKKKLSKVMEELSSQDNDVLPEIKNNIDKINKNGFGVASKVKDRIKDNKALINSSLTSINGMAEDRNKVINSGAGRRVLNSVKSAIETIPIAPMYSAIGTFYNYISGKDKNNNIYSKSKSVSPEKEFKDMKTLAEVGTQSEKSVISAVGKVNSIDFTEMNKTGVDKYLKSSGITKGMASQAKGFLEHSLKVGGGTKAGTIDSLEHEFNRAKSSMAGGVDIHDTLRTIGLDFKGRLNIDQIRNLSKSFSSGDLDSLVARKMHLSKSEARKYTTSLGKQVGRYAEENALGTNADPSEVTRMYENSIGSQNEGTIGYEMSTTDTGGRAGSELYAAYLKDKKHAKKLFDSAKLLKKEGGSGDDHILTRAAIASDIQQKNHYSKKDMKMIEDMASMNNLKEGSNFKSVIEDSSHIVGKEQAMAVLRKATGKQLNTKYEQQDAMKIYSLMKINDKNQFVAKSDAEIKQEYEKDIAKKNSKKKLNMQEQGVIDAVNKVAAQTGVKAKDVTGSEISNEILRNNGIGGTTKEVLAEKMNGKGPNAVESLLGSIDNNIKKLIQITDKTKPVNGNHIGKDGSTKGPKVYSIDADGTKSTKAKDIHKKLSQKVSEHTPKPSINNTDIKAKDIHKKLENKVNDIVKHKQTGMKKTDSEKMDDINNFINTNSGNSTSIHSKINNIVHKKDMHTKDIHSTNDIKEKSSIVYNGGHIDRYHSHVAKHTITKESKKSLSMEERYKHTKDILESMSENREKKHMKDGTRDYKMSLGGDKASNISLTAHDHMHSKSDQKRDSLSQTNTLLERIAAATEAMRNELKSAGPAIKKT